MDHLRSFWSQLESQSRAACRSGPDIFLRIAGRAVRLMCSSPALWDVVSPALAPLTVRPTRHVDLTIHAWDSASSGVEPPSAIWQTEDILPQGLIRGLEAHELHIAVQPGAVPPGFQALSMWDPATRHAVWWSRDVGDISSAEITAPFRDILHWWSHSWHAQLAHAAVVGWNGWGLLLAAPDGQGKSTTALLCRDTGFEWLGDDDVLLVPKVAAHSIDNRAASPSSHIVRFGHGPAPYAHRLYGTVTLDRGHLERAFAHHAAASLTVDDNSDRAVLRVASRSPHTCDAGLPLCAVLIPTLTADPVTRVESATFAAALRALAPSTVSRLPGEQLQTTQQLAEIVRRLPAYHLQLGTDLTQIPHVLASFIQSDAAHAA